MRIQAVKGMKDGLPAQMRYWHHIEKTVRALVERYGYQEIRTPIVERRGLFERTAGASSDLVMKEIYTLFENTDDPLSLRPEGTASVVRAGLEHGLLYNKIQRLWYMGPMFRHERPQKGRYRQFHQFGVELYGMDAPETDVEIILLSARFWEALGLKKDLKLHLHSLGDLETRQRYQQALTEYFKAHYAVLDEDSQRRLLTNPLRILDSKNFALKDLIDNAPRLLDVLSDPAKQHFEVIQGHLNRMNIEYIIDHHLVRGLDYYTHTVFEWTTNALGAQNAVSGGGRYDTLVEQLGGKSTSAVGFAVGLERVIALLESNRIDIELGGEKLDLYFIVLGVPNEAMKISEQLRDDWPTCKIIVDYSGTKATAQFKRADQSGAQLALILGEEEVTHEAITVRLLRKPKAEESTVTPSQQTFPQHELNHFLESYFSRSPSNDVSH